MKTCLSCAASSVPPRSLSYNPAENAVLVGSDAENGSYELYVVPKEAKGESSPVRLQKFKVVLMQSVCISSL